MFSEIICIHRKSLIYLIDKSMCKIEMGYKISKGAWGVH